MQFVNEIPRPSQESQKAIDDCTELLVPHAGNFQEWLTAYAHNHRERLAFDLDMCEQYCTRSEAILEVGSAPLLLTGALAESGFQVTGVDIDPKRLASPIEQLGLKIIQSNIEIEPLPINDASVDCVLCNEVFEHLRVNLNFTFGEIFRVLKPSGQLFLSTPNLRSLMGIYNFLVRKESFSCIRGVYQEYSKLESLGHMGHVREYTTVEVKNFLSEIGFVPETIVWRGHYNGYKAKNICRLKPSLRPFFSMIAKKPS